MLMLRLGFLVCLGLGLVCCQDVKKADQLLSNLIFTEYLLYERKGMSAIGCARLCLKTDRCVTFTFTPVTSGDDVCRGHSAGMSSSMAHEASAGTDLYVKVDWLDRSCLAGKTWQCAEANSRCRQGRCMCIHGYYYSVGAKACHEDCSPSDLQTTYLPFDNCALRDHNLAWLPGLTHEACKSRCDADNLCLHYEYGTDQIGCAVSRENTRQLTPADGWTDPETRPGWTHYQ